MMLSVEPWQLPDGWQPRSSGRALPPCCTQDAAPPPAACIGSGVPPPAPTLAPFPPPPTPHPTMQSSTSSSASFSGVDFQAAEPDALRHAATDLIQAWNK